MKAGRPWDRGTPPSAFLLLALDVLNIGLEIVAYDVLLGRGQPICIGRFVLQNEIDDDAQKSGRKTFHHEQPLPAGQAAEAVHNFKIPPQSGQAMALTIVVADMKIAMRKSVLRAPMRSRRRLLGTSKRK